MSTTLQGGAVSSGEGCWRRSAAPFALAIAGKGAAVLSQGGLLAYLLGAQKCLCWGKAGTGDKVQPHQYQHHSASNKTKSPQKNETTNKGCFFILFPNPSLDC